MKRQKIILSILILTFIASVITIVRFNNWVSRQVDEFSNRPIQGEQPKNTEAVGRPKPKPVVIDPDNDPLAPVVKKKLQKSPSHPYPLQMPNKFFDIPIEDVILVQ